MGHRAPLPAVWRVVRPQASGCEILPSASAVPRESSSSSEEGGEVTQEEYLEERIRGLEAQLKDSENEQQVRTSLHFTGSAELFKLIAEAGISCETCKYCGYHRETAWCDHIDETLGICVHVEPTFLCNLWELVEPLKATAVRVGDPEAKVLIQVEE